MSTADLVTAIFGLWALLGFMAVLQLPKPKTKGGALVQWIVSGPFGWLIGLVLIVLAIVDAGEKP